VRGSPLWRAFAAFLAILSLGYPLRRLTSGDAGDRPTAAKSTPVAASKEIVLQLTFTTAPKRFIVQHLGRELWSEAAPQSETERKLQLPYPKEGVDFHFQADFPEGGPLAAVRIRLTDPQGDNHEKSVWGTGSIDEVVTFP
jgi:hypothetical protein